MCSVLLSIVIPHYNTPDSLMKLINSIPATNEIEVIVVDDNSSVDLSGCRKFIDKRENVHLYMNDSGTKGAGASRNVGLRHVQGEWLLFADADDFFLDGFYDKAAPYLHSDYDMIYFAPTSMDVGTGKASSRHIMYMEL